MVDTAGGRRRVRLAHGGCTRRIHPSLRPQEAAGVSGRDQPPKLLSDATPPEPMAPGKVAREDYEYVRGGVCNLFVITEPLAGWRHVSISERRTRIDFA